MAEESRDLLGAVDLAAELETLATRVTRGTTIALFGSWGIGKTRIGELLGQRLKLTADLPYIRFDASQGLAQELPERFVLECAEELNADVNALKEQLRAERKVTKWALRFWHASLPLLIAGGLASMVVVALLIALVVALVSDATFGEVVNDYVLAAVVAPAVLGSLVGVAAKSLSEELTLKPTTIDFPKAYQRLLIDCETAKVVVFVDELDRCPPDKLVDSLRALEAFFASERTVFVVAVDRQAVERALTTSLGEHAPESVANDYYTAGSAYLDKLFKHQLTIPPLRSHALYEYARAKTGGKQPWLRFETDPLLLRILIPPHVTSPRQVARLVRSFELTYSLLARRAGELAGQEPREPGLPRLAPRVHERAHEIAKLVCLRCEFPRFAADLHVDPELPELVLEAMQGDLGARALAAHRADRAMAYAGGRLPVSRLPAEGDQDAELSGEEVGAELRQQRSRQLLRYLDDTRGVEGPGRDLVHAQGVDSELPQELADKLERVSRSGEIGLLGPLVEAVRHTAKQAAGVQGRSPAEVVREAEGEVLHLLSRRTRSRNGDESGPAIHVLLGAVPMCNDSLDKPTASRVLGRIDLYLSNAGDLDEQEADALERLREAASAVDTDEPAATPALRNGQSGERATAQRH